MYEKSLKGPVVYIRHAESKFNQIMLDSNNFHLKNSRELIDCGITETGKIQCEILGKSLYEIKIRTVFISPLNRTIETCYESLKDYPELEKIKFIILPLASEIISSSCDIPMSLQEKKSKFQSYKNFNLEWHLYTDYFFLDNIDEINFKEILEEINLSDYEQNFHVYEKALDICLGKNKSGESIKHLYQRSLKLKSFLKNFLVSSDIEENEKILVYTHSAISKVSSSSDAQNNEHLHDFPEDCYMLENCEYLTMNL